MNRKLLKKLKQEFDLSALHLAAADFEHLLVEYFKEDAPEGDLTSDLVLEENPSVDSYLVVRHAAVVAGLPLAQAVFAYADREIVFKPMVKEGDHVQKDQRIAEVYGPIKSLLKAERTAINVLQHLCGVATAVNRCVAVADKYGVKITDTRKTIPLMRTLQKYAVTVGGGKNHRFNLSDGVLIKDNHINSIDKKNRCRAIRLAVELAKRQDVYPVEVEVESLKEVRAALSAGADIIMLDNMNPARMRQAVKLIDKRALVEASGGISIKNLENVARTGVDFISLGRITHSVQAVDISMEIVL